MSAVVAPCYKLVHPHRIIVYHFYPRGEMVDITRIERNCITVYSVSLEEGRTTWTQLKAKGFVRS